jgi:hypothetical protein
LETTGNSTRCLPFKTIGRIKLEIDRYSLDETGSLPKLDLQVIDELRAAYAKMQQT